MSWKKSERLMDTIKHYSGFPATGVSLRQMVQFGERPSTGMEKLEGMDLSSAKCVVTQAPSSAPPNFSLRSFPYA